MVMGDGWLDTIARGEKLEAVGTEIGLPRTPVSSGTSTVSKLNIFSSLIPHRN